MFFIGRGADFPLCREGSLKLKEISYIHSEAYEAGELKPRYHFLDYRRCAGCCGSYPVGTAAQTISNIEETRARGAQVILLCKQSDEIGEDVYDHIIRLPDLDDLFAPILGVIPLQLMAYHTAVAAAAMWINPAIWLNQSPWSNSGKNMEQAAPFFFRKARPAFLFYLPQRRRNCKFFTGGVFCRIIVVISSKPE